MSCVSCSYVGNTVFFTEEYPCKCGDTVVVSYNMCPSCGSFWRSCNGDILDEVDVINSIELRDMIIGNDVTIDDCFVEQGDLTMEDCIIRCVKCNSVAYEISTNKYKCSECPAEWEVLESG